MLAALISHNSLLETENVNEISDIWELHSFVALREKAELLIQASQSPRAADLNLIFIMMNITTIKLPRFPINEFYRLITKRFDWFAVGSLTSEFRICQK